MAADASVTFDDEIQLSDEPCPKCGKGTRWAYCRRMGCDDGYVDMHEYDDPLWYDEGELERCNDCRGTGVEKWCPHCGWDLVLKVYMNGQPEADDERR